MSDQEIKPDDLIMSWHCSYYDHPLNGVALLNNKPVWFSLIHGGWEEIDTLPENKEGLSESEKESIDLDAECWYRDLTYNLYPLSDEQYRSLLKKHEDGIEEYKEKYKNTLVAHKHFNDHLPSDQEFIRITNKDEKIIDVNTNILSQGKSIGEFKSSQFKRFWRK